VITTVHLENWRAYKSFSIDLQPGTTFLVAPNGVGKTSFIEAVQWALDRDAKPTSKVMRRRARATSVDVTLLAGDTRVRIKRTLTLGRGKTPADHTDAWIDDQTAEPSHAFRTLANVWEADNRFVSRAAFLTDRFVDKDPDPDLRAHLTRLHALDNVQAAITSIATALKAASQEADSARKSAAASDAELAQAIRAVENANERLESAVATSEQLRAAATASEEARREAATANETHAAYQSWMSARDALAGDVSVVLGTQHDALDLRTTLRAAEAAATRQLMQNAEHRAVLRERLDNVEKALERLREAGAECPICRRPLDDASRHYAEEQHEHDRTEAAQQLSSLDDAQATTVAAELAQLRDRAEQLGDPPEPPKTEPVELEELQARAHEAKTSFEKSLEDVGQAQRAVAEATARVETIRADLAAVSRSTLYTKVAALEASQSALENTITRVLNAQLGPVRDEVNRRWEAIFPDRPGLRIDPDGTIARAFDDDDAEDLDFGSFSSGEQVVAELLLRLATLTSTTRVPFWLIDEPLEHLDPDARSYVARTLAYLGSGAGLRQIFVTTYEEELAMQLVAIARDQVHLEFLRTTHVPA
jgi:DNA repair exonuclease SbcCD ATPase subunit